MKDTSDVIAGLSLLVADLIATLIDSWGNVVSDLPERSYIAAAGFFNPANALSSSCPFATTPAIGDPSSCTSPGTTPAECIANAPHEPRSLRANAATQLARGETSRTYPPVDRGARCRRSGQCAAPTRAVTAAQVLPDILGHRAVCSTAGLHRRPLGRRRSRLPSRARVSRWRRRC